MSEKKRPEWMSSISGIVDPNDYLSGRKIDKTFELSQQEKAEKRKEVRTNLIAANKIKLSEDPLLDLERRKYQLKLDIISNPIRLRQFRERLLKEEAKKQNQPNSSTSQQVNNKSSKQTQGKEDRHSTKYNHSSSFSKQHHRRSRSRSRSDSRERRRRRKRSRDRGRSRSNSTSSSSSSSFSSQSSSKHSSKSSSDSKTNTYQDRHRVQRRLTDHKRNYQKEGRRSKSRDYRRRSPCEDDRHRSRKNHDYDKRSSNHKSSHNSNVDGKERQRYYDEKDYKRRKNLTKYNDK